MHLLLLLAVPYFQFEATYLHTSLQMVICYSQHHIVHRGSGTGYKAATNSKIAAAILVNLLSFNLLNNNFQCFYFLNFNLLKMNLLNINLLNFNLLKFNLLNLNHLNFTLLSFNHLNFNLLNFNFLKMNLLNFILLNFNLLKFNFLKFNS